MNKLADLVLLSETWGHRSEGFLLKHVFSMRYPWACNIVLEHGSNGGKGKVQYWI